MNGRVLCAIPARAGSKRLADKNILSLAGKPMIAYSIEKAGESGLFESVYVCTEDPTIAEISRNYGAEVPLLMPPELCGDLVPSHVPCTRMADYLADQNRHYDFLLCLQPTSPLRTVTDITDGINKFLEMSCDFLVSVTPIDPHYFHWALQSTEDQFWRMYFGSEFMKERPLLPPVYRPNGSIKIARLDKLKQLGHFFGPKLAVTETSEERSVHVATKFDFDLCEFLLERDCNA
jgi:CMP-N,N'-diacetyllegionaminic acid synthase